MGSMKAVFKTVGDKLEVVNIVGDLGWITVNMTDDNSTATDRVIVVEALMKMNAVFEISTQGQEGTCEVI
jgi:hypothetical protein